MNFEFKNHTHCPMCLNQLNTAVSGVNREVKKYCACHDDFYIMMEKGYNINYERFEASFNLIPDQNIDIDIVRESHNNIVNYCLYNYENEPVALTEELFTIIYSAIINKDTNKIKKVLMLL